MDAEIMVTKTENHKCKERALPGARQNLAAPVQSSFLATVPPKAQALLLRMFCGSASAREGGARRPRQRITRVCLRRIRKSRSCVFCTEWPFA